MAASDISDKTLKDLEKNLAKRIVGQDHILKNVSLAIQRSHLGLGDSKRPLASFLFLGPTGIGKTELAKALAKELFGSDELMYQVDMSEFMEMHSVAKLIGSPPGYVGYQEGGQLTKFVKKKPYSVILFDEIEKAHPDVVNAFLQLLDEGRMADSAGRVVSFRDAIIIATSNAGADKIREHIAAGTDVADFQEQFMDELVEANLFRPEFLNRFDEMVIFRPLNESELAQVVTLMINDVNKTLAQQKISVELDDDAKMWLVKKGNDPRLGARPMRRMVQRYVEDIVAQHVLTGQATPGTVITLNASDFELVAA